MKKNILLILFLLACFYGCRNEEVICTPVDNVPDTTYVFASSQQNLCLVDGKHILIDAYLDGALSYLWYQTGDTTSSIIISLPNTYSVEVTTPTTSYFWTISVPFCGNSLFIPNSFTPNDDLKSLNETWTAQGIGIGCFYMEVRNEDGILVFSTDDLHERWDGRINGSEEIGPCGFYFYYIECSFQMDSEISKYYGCVELIK